MSSVSEEENKFIPYIQINKESVSMKLCYGFSFLFAFICFLSYSPNSNSERSFSSMEHPDKGLVRNSEKSFSCPAISSNYLSAMVLKKSQLHKEGIDEVKLGRYENKMRLVKVPSFSK
jgi:hypothetical protein